MGCCNAKAPTDPLPPMIYRARPSVVYERPGHVYEILPPRRGKGLVVHSGARGVRIWFDEKSETFPGERSFVATTRTTIAREFERVWIEATNAGVEIPDLVFEVLDCAPAHVAKLAETFIVYRRDLGADGITIAQGAPLGGDEFEATRTVLLNSEAAIPLAEYADARVHAFTPYFIGGALSATAAFTLRLWARIDDTHRALVGSLPLATVDPDGNFSMNLDVGWRHNLGVQGTFVSSQLPIATPWELELYQPDGAEITVHGLVYVRE